MAEPAKRTEKPRALRHVAGAGEAVKLDQLIHERARLAIVSALAANATLSFQELRTLLGLTDGNLAVHARRLEEAGYVACEKGYAGRVPRTQYRLTAAGKKAFDEYVGHMEALLAGARPRRRDRDA